MPFHTSIKFRLAIALSLVMFRVAAVQAAAVFSVGAPIPVSMNVFAVPINIADAVGLTSWRFDLGYNAANVQVNVGCDPFSGDTYCALFSNPPPITEGPFFAAGEPFNVFNPGFIVLDSATMTQTGRLLGVEDTLGSTSIGISGAGVLAYIEFITESTGPPAISVAGGSPDPTTVPEPSTYLLLAAALSAAAIRRVSRSRFCV